MSANELVAVAEALGAQPRGDGSWFASACPVCGSPDALSLTERGAECRNDLCRWATVDLRDVLARHLARAGCGASDVARALGRLA